jgi:DNA-binding GntR family transcriptional regulator
MNDHSPLPGQRGHLVADRIAQDIQTGALAPGTWMRQAEVEARYGCSRGDARRALDELLTKRLVQHFPNRGHRVFTLEPERLQNIRQLRAILESAAIGMIADRATPAALAELEGKARAFEVAVAEGSPLQQHGANIAFHMALLALCPNPELVQAAIDARSRLPSALLWQWTTRGWIEQSVRDHTEMLAALRAGDHEALRRITVAHIRLNRLPSAPHD